MRKTLLILLSTVIVLSGCSIQYHNTKVVVGKATKIRTAMGNLEKATVDFRSTFDIMLGSIIKKEPIPPAAELNFANP